MLHTCTSCWRVHPQLSSQPVLRKVRSLFSGVLLEHFVNKSSSAPDHRVTVLTCGLQHWPCPAEILAAPAERLRSSRPNLCSRGTNHPVAHGVTPPGKPLSFSGMISNKPRREFGRSTSPPASEESELISDNLFQATQTHYYRDDRKKPWKNTCRRDGYEMHRAGIESTKIPCLRPEAAFCTATLYMIHRSSSTRQFTPSK